MSLADNGKVWTSPNHNIRKPGTVITTVVMHASAGKSDRADLTWLCDPASKVSYHCLITRDGQSHHLVDAKRRAWHAGVAEWKGQKDVNAVSLGLSFSNRHDQTEMLTASQIATAKDVIREWKRRIPTLTDVVTHAMIAPERKMDPNHCPNYFHADFADLCK